MLVTGHCCHVSQQTPVYHVPIKAFQVAQATGLHDHLHLQPSPFLPHQKGTLKIVLPIHTQAVFKLWYLSVCTTVKEQLSLLHIPSWPIKVKELWLKRSKDFLLGASTFHSVPSQRLTLSPLIHRGLPGRQDTSWVISISAENAWHLYRSALIGRKNPLHQFHLSPASSLWDNKTTVSASDLHHFLSWSCLFSGLRFFLPDRLTSFTKCAHLYCFTKMFNYFWLCPKQSKRSFSANAFLGNALPMDTDFVSNLFYLCHIL